MAAGISGGVEADDDIFELTKARLPWLILGLFGGLGSVYIMEGFEEALEKYSRLFYFTPLIAAMAERKFIKPFSKRDWLKFN